MKIPANERKNMADAINQVLIDNPMIIAQYRSGNFKFSEKTKDVNKRFRWDLLYMSKFNIVDLYHKYDCNDNHIDTVLRQICPQIN